MKAFSPSNLPPEGSIWVTEKEWVGGRAGKGVRAGEVEKQKERKRRGKEKSDLVMESKLIYPPLKISQPQAFLPSSKKEETNPKIQNGGPKDRLSPTKDLNLKITLNTFSVSVTAFAYPCSHIKITFFSI